MVAVERGERGFSLVEVLVAAAILLFVLLALLPIFTQSIVNNTTGNQYSQMTNAAKTELERLSNLPLESPDLVLKPGDTDKVTVEYFSETRHAWVDGATLGTTETPLWNRKVTVHQCDVLSFTDGRCATNLPGGVSPPAQIREVLIDISPGRDGTSIPGLSLLGLNKHVSLSSVKTF